MLIAKFTLFCNVLVEFFPKRKTIEDIEIIIMNIADIKAYYLSLYLSV